MHAELDNSKGGHNLFLTIRNWRRLAHATATGYHNVIIQKICQEPTNGNDQNVEGIEKIARQEKKKSLIKQRKLPLESLINQG